MTDKNIPDINPDAPINFSDFTDNTPKRGGFINIITMQAIICTIVMIAAVVLGTYAPAALETCRRKYINLVSADAATISGRVSGICRQVFGSIDRPKQPDKQEGSSEAPALSQTLPPESAEATPAAGMLNLISAPSEVTLLPVSSTVQFTVPISGGSISSFFGQRINPVTNKNEFHKALDIAADKSTPVFAAANGKVISSAQSDTLGNFVYIRHADGFTSVYGHLESRSVKQGDSVKSGDMIGRVGSTGRSTGYHLHFELRKNNVAVNPLYLIGND